MKKIVNNFIMTIILVTLLIIQVLYSISTKQDIEKAKGEIQAIIISQKKGKRVDPFRCSDAKKYFTQVGVFVDCVKIEQEVNN